MFWVEFAKCLFSLGLKSRLYDPTKMCRVPVEGNKVGGKACVSCKTLTDS